MREWLCSGTCSERSEGPSTRPWLCRVLRNVCDTGPKLFYKTRETWKYCSAQNLIRDLCHSKVSERKAFQKLHHRLTGVPICWPWSWSQGLPGGDGSPMRLVLSSVCAQAHSIRFSPAPEMPLKQYFPGGWFMSIPTVWLAGKRNCSAELVPRGEPEAKQWGRVCTRAQSTVQLYSSWGTETLWSTVQFFSSLPWDGACPDLFVESGAQLWQGPIAESWEVLH